MDGDGYSDSYSDGVPLPLWIDKSLSEKNAQQSVLEKRLILPEMYLEDFLPLGSSLVTHIMLAL